MWGDQAATLARINARYSGLPLLEQIAEQVQPTPAAPRAVQKPQPVEAATIPQAEAPAYILSRIADKWFRKYAVLPSRAAETFLTLWAAHTWYRDDEGKLAFKVTPRAYILSAKPGSAKSLVLSLLALMSYGVKSIELEPSGPGLKMILGREKGTPMLDEGDILFGSGRRKEEVRAILNGGYSQVGFGGTVTTGIGGSPNRVPVFGPVALAGLDVLETGTDDKLAALLSRGIKIRMTKSPRDLIKAMPRLEDDLVDGRAEDDAAAGRRALEWFASNSWDAVVGPESAAAARALLPDELDSRAAQIWNPLARIALVAGGEWPARLREAALELSCARGGQAVPQEFFASFGQ
jgi:Protein of unknown function (DUF3631)